MRTFLIAVCGLWPLLITPAAPPKYWVVPLEQAAKGIIHTHIETRGEVIYVRAQDDGDIHIKVAVPWNHALFIICECTLKEPCARPTQGADIIIRGLSRRDPEHGWWEIHPVDQWRYATAGE